MTTIECRRGSGATGCRHRRPARSTRGLPALGQGRRAVSVANRRTAAPPAPPARRTRAALATAESAPHRGPHRIPADRLGVRIFRSSSTSWRAAIFPIRICSLMKLHMPPYVQAGAEQRISAQPHHHAPDAHRRPVFRTVPLARFGRALRSAVPRSLPDAPLPGRPGAFALAPRLHLWRDGDVPAPLPAGGGPGGVCHRNRARGRFPAHRRALAAGIHRRTRAIA